MDSGISNWDIIAIIGTVSFALQGGIIAMEEEYDLFAVYLFGMLTSFGGGVLQNVIIGGSEEQLWNQELLFYVAFISITVALFFPTQITKTKMLFINYLDSFGVMAFAITGSIHAIYRGLPTSAVIVSAIITATGGGIIRDLLSQRKPVLLGQNIYGLWIFLIGLIMGFFGRKSIPYQYLIFIIFTTLRILSFHYNWKIPTRKLK